jgi:DNA polymerase I
VRHESLDEHWAYNCEDTVRTLECAEVETHMLQTMGLKEPNAAQQAMFYPVLDAMIRGVRIDLAARARMAGTLLEELTKREQYFLSILGHPLNPASPKQMKALFYDDLRQKIIINRKTGQPTLDDDALETLGTREPILRPLLRRIAEYRSLGVFLATFVNAPLDSDGRMRCSYNICGTETYRLASRKNAFGTGTNLQNVPKGGDEEGLELPNIRNLFIPDPGYTFFDMDLKRADLYVVVWEADDQELKHMLRSGIDVHTENAKVVGMPRQEAKKWVHGTNYGGSPRTMAINCGITVKQAEAMQKRWFEAHPGIHKWHQRTEANLRSKHYVENQFGYRRFYFDRVEALLPEALAWIPQSTVALTINKIWLKIFHEVKEAQVLLQVHDSIAGQYPTRDGDRILGAIKHTAGGITIPYPDPLVIPVNIKTSTKSWGDCE